MARVLATFSEKTSAEHRIKDGFLFVSSLAGSIINNWDLNVLEDSWKGSTALGSSPSRDDNLSGGLLTGFWERNGLNIGVKVEWGGDEEESNVIGKGPSIVVLVTNDASNLTSLFNTAVVESVKISSDNGVRASGTRVDAVRSSDDGLLSLNGYKGASANVATTVAEGDLVWEFSLFGILSSDDSVGMDFPLDLGEG